MRQIKLLRTSLQTPQYVAENFTLDEIIAGTEQFDVNGNLSAHYVTDDENVILLAIMHQSDMTPCVNIIGCYDSSTIEIIEERIAESINEQLSDDDDQYHDWRENQLEN